MMILYIRLLLEAHGSWCGWLRKEAGDIARLLGLTIVMRLYRRMVYLKERFTTGIDVGIDVSLLDDLPTDRAVYHDR